MVIVDLVLFIGKFFFYFYYICFEEFINLELVDKEVIIRGWIDVLVFKEKLWVMIIELKRVEFFIEVGLV